MSSPSEVTVGRPGGHSWGKRAASAGSGQKPTSCFSLADCNKSGERAMPRFTYMHMVHRLPIKRVRLQRPRAAVGYFVVTHLGRLPHPPVPLGTKANFERLTTYRRQAFKLRMIAGSSLSSPQTPNGCHFILFQGNLLSVPVTS